MPKHETALTDGQLAEFVAAGTKALILVAHQLGADRADEWARNGQAMQRAFLSVLKPEEKEETQTTPPPPTTILRKVTEVALGECAGTRTIADSGKVFTGYLDSSFRKIKANRATTPAKADVHEMAEDTTSEEMFGSLGRDLDTLVFTQDQVVEFCVTHRDKLRTSGYGTFFLLKEGNDFFVASVDVSGDRLLVGLHDFEDDHVWDGGNRHRVVVPQP